MSNAVIAQYTTRPEHAEENHRLVRDVFADLADTQPEGLRYLTVRLDDGVTFLHVAITDTGHNPLQDSTSFARFQQHLGERLIAPPKVQNVHVVGSYTDPQHSQPGAPN